MSKHGIFGRLWCVCVCYFKYRGVCVIKQWKIRHDRKRYGSGLVAVVEGWIIEGNTLMRANKVSTSWKLCFNLCFKKTDDWNHFLTYVVSNCLKGLWYLLTIGIQDKKQGILNPRSSCLLWVSVEELKLWFTVYPHTKCLHHPLYAHGSLCITPLFSYLFFK